MRLDEIVDLFLPPFTSLTFTEINFSMMHIPRMRTIFGCGLFSPETCAWNCASWKKLWTVSGVNCG